MIIEDCLLFLKLPSWLQHVGNTLLLHFKGASNRRSFIRWSLICKQSKLLHFDKVNKLALHLHVESQANQTDVEGGEKINSQLKRTVICASLFKGLKRKAFPSAILKLKQHGVYDVFPLKLK